MILLAIEIALTAGLYFFERAANHERTQRNFEQISQALEDEFVGTLQAYAQFLRGGAALFQSAGPISREAWAEYVERLDIFRNYPGIQGVGYNPLILGAEALAVFEGRIGSEDWPGYAVRPEGDRERYVPVLYLEPLNERNEVALGFDIYSEPNRRAAINRAIETGQPSVTARITLVQETVGDQTSPAQAGVLLILPVYASSERTPGNVTGVIVSVFRMGDLMTSVVGITDDAVNFDNIHVQLYDAASPDPAEAMFVSTDAMPTRAAQFRTEHQIDLFGRVWTLSMQSTEAFEAQAGRISHIVVLVAGALITVLMAFLIAAQVQRTKESFAASEALAKTNEKIAFLLGEVSHRSKNMLALVQSIARQTSGSGDTEYVQKLSRRLVALASSQDLLLRSEWSAILLADLVRSQLEILGDMMMSRVRISGPPVQLGPAAAQSLGMALHELATNATKYGALSTETGRIQIDWSLGEGEGSDFVMNWTETDGPTVQKAAQTGFGTRVTMDLVEAEFSGQVTRAFTENGMRWRLSCDVQALNASSKADVPSP